MTGTVFNDKNDNDTSGNYNNNDVYVAYVELSSIVGAKTKDESQAWQGIQILHLDALVSEINQQKIINTRVYIHDSTCIRNSICIYICVCVYSQ